MIKCAAMPAHGQASAAVSTGRPHEIARQDCQSRASSLPWGAICRGAPLHHEMELVTEVSLVEHHLAALVSAIPGRCQDPFAILLAQALK